MASVITPPRNPPSGKPAPWMLTATSRREKPDSAVIVLIVGMIAPTPAPVARRATINVAMPMLNALHVIATATRPSAQTSVDLRPFQSANGDRNKAPSVIPASPALNNKQPLRARGAIPVRSQAQ